MATTKKTTAKKVAKAPKKASAAPKAKTASNKVDAQPVQKVPSTPLSHGVGRRKSAVARVWLRRGSGKLIVNGKPSTQYFDTDMARLEAREPFLVIPNVSHYDAYANVRGGGLHAQAGATKLGISRALVAVDEGLRPLLRQHSLLTVDARLKERKKYGQRGARRKFQFVKR